MTNSNQISASDVRAVQTAIEGSPNDVIYRVADHLALKVADRMAKGSTPPNRQSIEVLKAFLRDTIEFIYKSYRANGSVTPTQVTKYMLEKHKNFLRAVGFDHAACGLAVADLIVTLTIAVPTMAAEANAMLLTWGIGVATGGMGVPFAMTQTGLLALSGLAVYLSASQTADVCSTSVSTLADRYGEQRYPVTVRVRPRAPMRCEIPVHQFTTSVLGLVDTSLRRQGPMTISMPLR